MEEKAYKYTDEHVRRDTDMFRRVATEYLEDYTGEFQLLLDYRHRVLRGVDLTVPMIRATLNCMRFDATFTDLLPEPPVREVKKGRVVEIDFSARRRKKERPLYINIVAKRWNLKYGISSHRAARTIHQVSADSGWDYNTSNQTWKPRVRWKCRQFHSMPGRVWDPSIELIPEADIKLMMEGLNGWKLCGVCQQITR